jgi:molybdate transport system substrate-binding protein|tara:strand:+ start:69355 stop:70101 length:747 start_codon:yes stop_codon:yes gene_type:complete
MRRLILLLLFFVSVPAMAQGPLVLAASSMQEALTDAADIWTRAGHQRPVLSFAATSALARQVEGGAPADLFLSADAEWMDHVERRGRLRPGTRRVLATNRLVLVLARSAGNPVRSRSAILRQLKAGPLALADPDAVPAGRYARQALESLGLWRDVEGRLARAENVRAALALVERGAAPMGVVYATDWRASDVVIFAGAFPRGSHAPIEYHAARLASSRHAEAAAFLGFLSSSAGQRALRRHGFGPPTP